LSFFVVDAPVIRRSLDRGVRADTFRVRRVRASTADRAWWLDLSSTGVAVSQVRVWRHFRLSVSAHVTWWMTQNIRYHSVELGQVSCGKQTDGCGI